MTTPTQHPHTNGTETDLSTSTVFDLLSDRRRRLVMVVLSRRVGAITIAELAEEIAMYEGERSSDRIEQLRVELHHNHVPRLVDANLVRYDPEAAGVRALPALSEFETAFELEQTGTIAPDR